MLYEMTCGCKITADERLRIKGTYRCPCIKAGRQAFFVTNCEDCGAEVKAKNSNTTRCPACRKIRLAEQNKIAKHKQRHGDKSHIEQVLKETKASEDAWDCMHRSQCMTDIIVKKRKKKLPCLGCQRYEKFKNAI